MSTIHATSKQIIATHSKFYNNLSEVNKRYFEHRVVNFIANHKFVGREGVEVTNKMKILIAVSAVKITFGYRNYLLSRVDTIIIYPKDYLSNITENQHKGEVNPRHKVIVFSWKDFKEGIKIENDNLNLGLHEFAHAMQFSFLKETNSSATRFKERFQNLLLFLTDKNEQKKLIDSGYLREYAFENQYEFFAVMVEHFFETPNEFQEKLPEIYERLKHVLNIDVEQLSIN